MNFIEIDSGKIAYRDRGTGNVTLVFLHGNSLSSQTYEHQFSGSLSDNFRLLALDFPGHGDSSDAADPSATYSFPGYASAMWEALETLGVKAPVLVGHSLGGNVALEMAGSDRETAGLMVIGTYPPNGDPACFMDGATPGFSPKLAFQETHSDEEAGAIAAFAMGGGGKEVPDYTFENLRRTDGRARVHLGESIAAGNYSDQTALVASYSRPIAMILGGNDGYVSRDYLNSLNWANLWGGEIQILEGCGHTPFVDDPQTFDGLLCDFANAT